MKVNTYTNEPNTGVLNKTEQTIIIKKNRWVDKSGVSHPMKFEEPKAFENKNVYFLYLFGGDTKGKHISLSFWQNQKFLWLQNNHWLQKEENIRYIVNILFLLGGITLGVLNYLK